MLSENKYDIAVFVLLGLCLVTIGFLSSEARSHYKVATDFKASFDTTVENLKTETEKNLTLQEEVENLSRHVNELNASVEATRRDLQQKQKELEAALATKPLVVTPPIIPVCPKPPVPKKPVVKKHKWDIAPSQQ